MYIDLSTALMFLYCFLALRECMANDSVAGRSDIHIYHFQRNEQQAKYARELYDRIRRECT